MSSRIPTELYRLILSFLTDPLDHYAVRRTSSFFYAQAEVAMYPSLALNLVSADFYGGPRGPHGAFLGYLQRTPKAALSVHSLAIRINRQPYPDQFITDAIASLLNLSRYAVYQDETQTHSHVLGWLAPCCIPFPGSLSTLIIRHFRLPKDIHILLAQQPQLEVLILDSDEVGYQYLRNGKLAQISNLLPKLRVLSCGDPVTASLLLPGRDMVALRYKNQNKVDGLTSNSVISLHINGKHKKGGPDISTAFPNVKVLYVQLDRLEARFVQALTNLETLRVETNMSEDRLESWASELLSWGPTLNTVEFILADISWRFPRHDFPLVIDRPSWKAWKDI